MSSDTEMGGPSPSFPTTRPSFVERMGSPAPLERARAAEMLVRSYWKPVYKYVRLRFGRANDDAKDLTQGFLARALEKDWLVRFDPRRGSFRAFLRRSLDGYVANEAKARGREKRGGGCTEHTLDFDAAEGELVGLEPLASDSVEAWFDSEWRRGLFAATLAELERALTAHGQTLRFEIFRRYDLVDDANARPTYEELARELGVAATDVTNHLAAARRTLRELLLQCLREQTADEEEFQRELRTLLGGS